MMMEKWYQQISWEAGMQLLYLVNTGYFTGTGNINAVKRVAKRKQGMQLIKHTITINNQEGSE